MSSVGDKVALIMLNWNSYSITLDCLLSLNALPKGDFCVFLVDNDSQDNSFELLKTEYETNKFEYDIHFIQAPHNYGFAGGNNIAIKEAYNLGYQYFWMLNNDTVVFESTLSELLKEMRNDSSVGIVGSKIYYYNSNLLWFAGGKINKWTGRTDHFGDKCEDEENYNHSKEIDFVTGCSLMFRRELLDTVGYMSDDYFLYYEDTDWNIRAKQLGWKIKYIPSSIVHHKVSISSGGQSNLAPYVAYYDIRNSFIMIQRTQRNWSIVTAFVSLLGKFIKKNMKIILHNQNKKRERSWYILKGVLDALQSKMGKHPPYRNKR